jgi:hypothetical protein
MTLLSFKKYVYPEMQPVSLAALHSLCSRSINNVSGQIVCTGLRWYTMLQCHFMHVPETWAPALFLEFLDMSRWLQPSTLVHTTR